MRTAISRQGALGLVAALVVGGWPGAGRGDPFTFNTPGGPVTINLTHAGPEGALVLPTEAPAAPAFRPPAIFTAPLPTGSGARALGVAGAFTAIADDATAASWNPGGLTQLERPEASVVYRTTRERNRHDSTDSEFRVGENAYDSQNINYISLVCPFRVVPIQRNAVVSLNYQEAYDFTQEFTADVSKTQEPREERGGSRSTYTEVQEDVVRDDVFDIVVRSHKTTVIESSFRQLLDSGLVSDLEFEQSGVIAALSPALAMDVTPTFAVGLAVNCYMNDVLSDGQIRSDTEAHYQGTSRSTTSRSTSRSTSGDYTYEGTVHLEPGGTIPIPIDIDVSGEGPFDTFTDAESSTRTDAVWVEGVYEEVNVYEELEGINATLGALWTVSRRFSVGTAVDLPWTASATQTQTTRNRSTTYDGAHGRTLAQADDTTEVTKDVEFRFPLFWSVGLVWRWTPELYSTFDLSQTQWSTFSYQAEGGERINPLDGSPAGEHPLDDTWAARAGLEYLVVLRHHEIPLRTGFAWEQRPAPDEPDEFYSVSLGTGLAFGPDVRRTILDVAYIVTVASDVHGIVPEEAGLSSDSEEHQAFISLIQHF